MDTETDGCHPPGLGETPKPLTHHFLASKPAFDLEFVIYHHHHGERQEAQQAISWWGGRGEPLFECGISALLWRPSQPGEMHVPRAWHSTLNLPGNKPQTHLANSDRWQGDGRATAATLWCSYSSPPALSLWFSFNEKKLESNHLNITLSQRKIIPYSLEK